MTDIPGPARAHSYALLGLIFDGLSMQEAKATIGNARHDRRQRVIATPNVNFLAEAYRDPAFRETIQRSDVSLVDGKPVLWLARLIGLPLPEKVSGSSLVEELIEHNHAEPVTVFFFGGMGDAAARASESLNRQRGGLVSVGDCNPGAGDISSMSQPEILEQINAANPDFLIVSLGARKGHQWIEHNREHLNAPIISHLGAVVNFVAGTQRRSPKILQHLGLEWTWRIYQEPGLIRRYAADAVTLLKLCTTQILPQLYYRFRYDSKPGYIDIEPQGESAPVTLDARLDTRSQHTLAHHLNRALTQPDDHLVLDFSQTRYINSALTAQLLSIQAAPPASGELPVNISLTGLSKSTTAQLKLQGVRV